MTIDKEVLLDLAQKKHLGPSEVKIGGGSYCMDITLENSDVPVTKPTTRGGVYFSEKTAFKIKAVSSDVGIAKNLSKAMLGPNQEFEEIPILAKISDDSGEKTLEITTHLINYVQKNSALELNMIVVGAKLIN